MATSKEILDDAELAKSYITQSTLSDDYKRTYLRLINIATMATNGISVEEKIQKMTECIQLLAVTQGMYLSGIDHRIDSAIEKANRKKCEDCQAMKHAVDISAKEQEKKMLEQCKAEFGLVPQYSVQQPAPETEKTWSMVIKDMLTKPYVYIALSLMAFSPYADGILQTIFKFIGK